MRFFVPTGKGVLEFNQKGAARKNTGCPFLKTHSVMLFTLIINYYIVVITTKFMNKVRHFN